MFVIKNLYGYVNVIAEKKLCQSEDSLQVELKNLVVVLLLKFEDVL